jgi:hypothetical protein
VHWWNAATGARATEHAGKTVAIVSALPISVEIKGWCAALIRCGELLFCGG